MREFIFTEILQSNGKLRPINLDKNWFENPVNFL